MPNLKIDNIIDSLGKGIDKEKLIDSMKNINSDQIKSLVNEVQKHEDVIKKGLELVGKGLGDHLKNGLDNLGGLFNIMQK